MVESILSIAVLCLAGSTATLAASVPFLYWKCFRLESRYLEDVQDLRKQVATLDEALARLLEGVGIPATTKDG